MIVKSAGNGLERCLESVAGCVDRIVIGSTGNEDEILEIASRFGAEVIAISWRDDFADARNQVLAHAACDWILVLDSDEMLDSTAQGALSALLSEPQIYGYSVRFCNYVEEPGHRCGGEQAVANPGTLEQARAYPAYFATESTRLFRRDPRIRYEHCVHETVVDSLEAAGLKRGRANFVIHHFGYADDRMGRRSRKDDLYYRLSLKKLAAAPTSYQAQLEVGMGELDHAKRPAAAFAHFTAATSLDPSGYAGWLYRGLCLTRMARYEEALQDLARAASLRPSNGLVHSALGDVYFETARYAEAQEAYGQARRQGDVSALSLAKLGASQVQSGMRREGLLKVQAAVKECPACKELLDILATTAWLAGDFELACNAAERRISAEGATGFHFLLAASIYKHAGKLAQAQMILQKAQILFPKDAEIATMIVT